jgi:hypothetical protein
MSGMSTLSPELLTHVFEYVLGDQYAGALRHAMLISHYWKV